MGRDPVFVEKSIQRARDSGVSEETLDRMQGYTGCIAEFDTGRAGPVTALRFDIDCVGVEETDKEEHLPNKENSVLVIRERCTRAVTTAIHLLA